MIAMRVLLGIFMVGSSTFPKVIIYNSSDSQTGWYLPWAGFVNIQLV